MRIAIILITFLAIFLISCQKELDSGPGNGGSGGSGGGGGTSGSLLVKTVQKTGSDSLVTLYTYNAANKISNIKNNGIDETGSPVDREYRYYRNSSGIVTHYSIIDADLAAQGIDSVVTIVHYNSSTSRYTSYVINISILGFTLLDSSAFVYDGAGKIIREDFYESPTGLAANYYLSGKADYTYTAGNLTQIDIHDLDATGAEVFTAQTKSTYDSKSNPLHFDNESFALAHPEWISVNNIAGEQLSDSNGPQDNQTVTISYTYNSANKPLTSASTVVPGSGVINTSFYYQ